MDDKLPSTQQPETIRQQAKSLSAQQAPPIFKDVEFKGSYFPFVLTALGLVELAIVLYSTYSFFIVLKEVDANSSSLTYIGIFLVIIIPILIVIGSIMFRKKLGQLNYKFKIGILVILSLVIVVSFMYRQFLLLFLPIPVNNFF